LAGPLCGSAEIPLSLHGENGPDEVNKRLIRHSRFCCNGRVTSRNCPTLDRVEGRLLDLAGLRIRLGCRGRLLLERGFLWRRGLGLGQGLCRRRSGWRSGGLRRLCRLYLGRPQRASNPPVRRLTAREWSLLVWRAWAELGLPSPPSSPPARRISANDPIVHVR
jgi:hypothetical protein